MRPGGEANRTTGWPPRRVAVGLRLRLYIPPLDVGGERAKLALEECGGFGTREKYIATCPFFHMTAISAWTQWAWSAVKASESVVTSEATAHVSVESGPPRVVRHVVPLVSDRPKMGIGGTGKAPDRSETGRETLSSKPLGKETGRACRE